MSSETPACTANCHKMSATTSRMWRRSQQVANSNSRLSTDVSWFHRPNVPCCERDCYQPPLTTECTSAAVNRSRISVYRLDRRTQRAIEVAALWRSDVAKISIRRDTLFCIAVDENSPLTYDVYQMNVVTAQRRRAIKTHCGWSAAGRTAAESLLGGCLPSVDSTTWTITQ